MNEGMNECNHFYDTVAIWAW